MSHWDDLLEMDSILARHRAVWRRRSLLVLVNAVAASLVLGAILGGAFVEWWRG